MLCLCFSFGFPILVLLFCMCHVVGHKKNLGSKKKYGIMNLKFDDLP